MEDTPGLGPDDLVRAAAAEIGRGDAPFVFRATVDPAESCTLCIAAVLLPAEERHEFMNAWVAVTEMLMRQHGVERVKSTRPAAGAEH